MTGRTNLFHGVELPLNDLMRKIKEAMNIALGITPSENDQIEKEAIARISHTQVQHARIIAFINYLFKRINDILQSSMIEKLITFFKHALIIPIQKIQLQNIIHYTHTTSRP